MNIFKILKRGNVRNEEYFSSSLALILSQIPEITSFLIKRILGTEITLREYEVVLEDTFEEGRIDIAIKSLELEVYIENKISAPLGDEQLERYSRYLQEKTKDTKLILLSRDYIEDESVKECADKYLFWSELYEMMEDFLEHHSKGMRGGKVYLINQFLDFLREENMSNEKVSWEYSKGTKSFLNLLNMIRAVLEKIRNEESFIKIMPVKKIGAVYAGFWINDKDFWVGVYYSDLEKVYFEYQEKFVKRCKNSERFENLQKTPGGASAKIYDFNENYFLAITKEKQKKEIYDFVKECLKFTQRP